MSLSINTNLEAMVSHRALVSADASVSRSIQRLSSGLRINSAADDAAGSAVSTVMKAQISGLDQANRNAQDGISVVNTMDAALGQAQSILQRARDLAVQWDNGTYSIADLQSIQDEWTQLSNEIGTIADTTQFNGIKLLQSNLAQLTLQVGANQGDTILVTLASLMGPGAGDLVHANSFFAIPFIPQSADLVGLDDSINDISVVRAQLGATANRLQDIIDFNSSQQGNLMRANSSIVDVDMAAETTNLTRAQILQQSSTAMLHQANQNKQMILQLLDSSFSH